jgi:hypothetical protein
LGCGRDELFRVDAEAVQRPYMAGPQADRPAAELRTLSPEFPRLDESSRYVARDLQRFRNGSPLRDESGYFIGRRQVVALGQFLYVQVDDLFHVQSS